mmetsp:Transcript_117734/g.227076  ORF Transcript_117734/g.227076 Transcript_117734/m.227076 type:complete len:217 (-) Transcript_117734:699-1349(-)
MLLARRGWMSTIFCASGCAGAVSRGCFSSFFGSSFTGSGGRGAAAGGATGTLVSTTSAGSSSASLPLDSNALRRLIILLSGLWEERSNCIVANSFSKFVIHRGLVPAIMSVFVCRSISRQLFISVWKCSNGKSLSSVPNGFSSSLAMKFRENIPNTGTNAKMAARTLLLITPEIIIGVKTVWSKSKKEINWAYGKGKRVSVIFLAFKRFTKPRDIV